MRPIDAERAVRVGGIFRPRRTRSTVGAQASARSGTGSFSQSL
jgi:hypothetical protein